MAINTERRPRESRSSTSQLVLMSSMQAKNLTGIVNCLRKPKKRILHSQPLVQKKGMSFCRRSQLKLTRRTATKKVKILN
jgi:hypothetical protein